MQYRFSDCSHETRGLLLTWVFLSSFVAHVHSEDDHPGTVGYSFAVFTDTGVLFRGPGAVKGSAFEITVTPYDTRGALVVTECPTCLPGVFGKTEKLLLYNERYIIEPPSAAPINPGKASLGAIIPVISISCSFLVSVMLNYQPTNQDLGQALVLPSERLDNKYILTNYDLRGFLAVIPVTEGQTDVYLKSPPDGLGPACKGVQGDLESQTPVTLDQFQTWVMTCDYLTGTFVYASKAIAVFVGNVDSPVVSPQTTVQPNDVNKTFLIEPSLPLSACGRGFVVPGILMDIVPDAFIRIVACYNEVRVKFLTEEISLQTLGSFIQKDVPAEGTYLECTMGCQVTLFYYSSPTKPATKGGDSMVNLIPVQLFSRLVTFSVADVKIGGDEVFLILILPHSDFSIVMCHGSTCGRWTEVDQSGILPHWKVFFKTFSAKEAYTVFHRNMTRFGLYVFKPALGKGAISAAGFDLPTQDCLTTIMEIDDNMDNDCDGNIDEEIENEEDDDGDGRVDEDLRIPSRSVVIHGVWSVWSPWDCWATCGGAARYRRYRYCDRPPPSAQGRDCPGDFVEYSNRICDYTNVPCFKDCPFTKWGPRCDEDCPTGCLHRTCDYDTGHCMGCRPGRMGDQCEMECPRFHFGAGCNQSCLEFCIDHCDPETGECDFDLKLMHVLVSILTMGIIPGVLFYAGIVLCKKQDPDLRALKDTLHSVDEQTNEVKLFTKARELNHKELRRRLKKKPSNWSAQIPAPAPVPEPEKPVGQKPGPDASFIKMAASAVEMVVKLPKGTSAGSVK